MSTKFSVRPAVRKSPWICKRSPPCLIPPPFPASLLCSFYIKHQPPAPWPEEFGGCLLLRATTPTGPYIGTYTDGSDWINVDFNWGAWATIGEAAANWSIASISDGDWWTQEPVGPQPNVSYASYTLVNKNDIWTAQIHITN